jgi:hypothetical protein
VIEQHYNIPPGGSHRGAQPPTTTTSQGGVQRSQAIYDVEPRRAQPPAGLPAPDAARLAFRDDSGDDWEPSDTEQDPHDDDFDDGDYQDAAAVPSNIVTGPIGDVDADFDDGGDDGYSADDFGDVPENIIV